MGCSSHRCSGSFILILGSGRSGDASGSFVQLCAGGAPADFFYCSVGFIVGMWQDLALFSSNRLQQHPQNRRSSSGTVRQAPTLSTKVVHSFVHDPFSKGLDGNLDGLCSRLLNVTIRDVLHCPTEENISVILHPDLTLRAVRSAKQSWMPSSFLGSLLRTHPL